MEVLSAFALPHVAAGTVALLTFWTTAALRKGSRPHRLVGRVYLLAMAVVVVTGVPLTVARALDGQTVGATFLAYLLLLVSTSVWLSWRAIRDRASATRYFGRMHAALAIANPLAGFGVLALGLSVGSTLLTGFSLVGVFTGLDMWRRRRVMPARPNWWLQEHYGAMVANGAATHVAFLALGLPRLLPEVVGSAAYLAGWFLPVVLAVVATTWLDRRHARPQRPRAGAPAGTRLRAPGTAAAVLLALGLVAGPARAADLVIDIEDVGSQQGRLTAFVYDSAAGWDGGRPVVPLQRVYPDGGTRLQARFTGLAPGRYAVVVLHDTNANGRFDVSALGIPKDDYGFSNNPVLFGRPDFDRIAFELPAAGARISVRMK